MYLRTLPFLLLLAAPDLAMAQDREFCPDRPGIGSPPCTVDKGRLSFETGLGDWTLNRDAGDREDIFVFGDFLIRAGVADHAEIQLGWTSLGFARNRDEAGRIDKRSGTGDVMLALRRNFANPDGSGFSVAAMPFVTLPVGRQPIGAGDWGGGLNVPISYEVSSVIKLEMVPELDAEVDDDGQGRHLAFGNVFGVSANLSDTVSATAEYQLREVRETGDHHAEHLSGLSLAWQTSDRFQIDLGANAGLDRDADDFELYMGISRRF